MSEVLKSSHFDIDKKVCKRNLINDLFFATIICLPAINELFTYLFNVSSGISRPLIVFFIFYTCVFNRPKIVGIQMGITFMILIAYMCSILALGTNSTTIDYLTNYIYYGITPLFYINTEHNSERIIMIISYIGMILIVYYMFIGYDTLDAGEIMRRSNVLLPCGLAIIYKAFINVRKEIISKFISILFLALFIYLIFSWGTRGAMVSVLIYILIVLLSKVKKMKVTFMLSFLCMIVLTTIMRAQDILIALKTELSSMGVNAFWIDKTVILLSRDDVSNGRYDIWIKALDSIKENWILGSGIGGFELKNGIYTHNLILQIMVDFGLFVGSACVISLLYLTIKSVVHKKNIKQKQYVLFLMMSCVGVLMVSSVPWYFPTFWLYIYESIKLIND